jgi:hypothetical protein
MKWGLGFFCIFFLKNDRLGIVSMIFIKLNSLIRRRQQLEKRIDSNNEFSGLKAITILYEVFLGFLYLMPSITLFIFLELTNVFLF